MVRLLLFLIALLTFLAIASGAGAADAQNRLGPFLTAASAAPTHPRASIPESACTLCLRPPVANQKRFLSSRAPRGC